MLSVVALLWGVLSILGMLAGLIPCLSGISWLNLPFAITGAVVGIVAILSRPQGGTKSAVAGTALCMLASIVGMLRLVMLPGNA